MTLYTLGYINASVQMIWKYVADFERSALSLSLTRTQTTTSQWHRLDTPRSLRGRGYVSVDRNGWWLDVTLAMRFL